MIGSFLLSVSELSVLGSSETKDAAGSVVASFFSLDCAKSSSPLVVSDSSETSSVTCPDSLSMEEDLSFSSVSALDTGSKEMISS